MSGTFFGINVATSGLNAQRLAMDVLSQNIANANDPAYKRQRVVMSDGLPIAQPQEAGGSGGSSIGSGVQAGNVQRVRDGLIEHRLQQAGASSSQWDFMAKTMAQVEAALGEPSDTGLQADLQTFWDTWSKVATSPDSIALRTTLLENTQALCSRIQYTFAQIGNIRDDLNLAARDSIQNFNQMTDEIARLNSEISVMSGGSDVNSLLNRRDQLVQDLSKMASISQFGEGAGDFLITLGGRVLVQGTNANALTTKVDANGNQAILWASDDQKVVLSAGELKALEDLRDVMIPNYVTQINEFATDLVDKVNTIHKTGKTMTGADAGDFFVAGTAAGTITLALDPTVADDPRRVATSSTLAVGGNDIATQIANLGNVVDPATGLSINQQYRALVGSIGSASASATKQATAQSLSLQQFTTQQQSISGVSLDEEMTNMIKFQQAYNASARVLTVMNDMLGTLMSTGVVGR